MDSGDVLQILLLIVLLLLSAFFSSAETALTVANRIKLQGLSEEGNKRAATVLKITDNSSKMLSAILIGNNLVNILTSSLATVLAVGWMGEGAVGLVTGILTIVVLIFGEITPKTYAVANADRLALIYGGIIYGLMKLLTPLIFIINSICRLILKCMRVNADRSMNVMTERELRTIVDVSHKDGVIEKEEREMIYNVVDFGDSLAKDIMVPRADMIAVNENASYEAIREVFRLEKYTRLPVYRNDRDNIIGIINIKDFFFYEQPHEFSAARIMYEPFFTYEFKKTSELLLEMQKASASIAVVIDEYGSCQGILSLEDLLEEIVGEIRDEYDEDEADLIRKISEREYLIDGSVKLDDINDALNLSLSSEDYDSIGGLLIELLDHLPSEGEAVTTENHITLIAERMDGIRIEEVKLIVPHMN